jgi:hypothetical protein
MAKYSKGPNGRELAYPADRFDEIFSRWAPYPTMRPCGHHYQEPYPIWAQARWANGLSIGKALEGKRKRDGSPDLEGSMYFSPFCRLDLRERELPENAYGLAIQTRVPAIEAVIKRTIIVDNDSMSWEVIEWEHNAALVLCRHSLIIGDVWVAVIDARSVPLKEGEAK